MLDLVSLLVAVLIVALIVVLSWAAGWIVFIGVAGETRHERKLRRLCQKQDRLRRDEKARKLWLQVKDRLEEEGGDRP